MNRFHYASMGVMPRIDDASLFRLGAASGSEYAPVVPGQCRGSGSVSDFVVGKAPLADNERRRRDAERSAV